MLLLAPLYAALLAMFAIFIKRGNVQLLDPAGTIADAQSKILWGALIFAAVLGSTIILTFFFLVFRYKEGGRAKYEPTWTVSRKLLIACWGVPSVVIVVVSALVWVTAHQVDPYRPINAGSKAITIQVVALQWKWLFIYPDDRIATVNMLEFPAGTPVSLQLTADAPMNSFWIPRLSGQIYAMSGMVTQLHIKADKPGTFMGSPAEMSGADFAGMDFTVKAVSASDYANWKTSVKQAGKRLDYASYKQLAQPSGYLPESYYTVADRNLFQAVVMQYMVPGTDPSKLEVKGTNI